MNTMYPYSLLSKSLVILLKAEENSTKLCQHLKNPDASNFTNSTVEIETETSVLLMPCYIIGTWIFITGIGFVFLGFKNLSLPKYCQSKNTIEDKKFEKIDNISQQNKWQEIMLVFCGIISIFLINGIDITFQSQIYIYGLCGPLNLSPEYAGWLNTLYYANYMVGRLVSIPLSTIGNFPF